MIRDICYKYSLTRCTGVERIIGKNAINYGGGACCYPGRPVDQGEEPIRIHRIYEVSCCTMCGKVQNIYIVVSHQITIFILWLNFLYECVYCFNKYTCLSIRRSVYYRHNPCWNVYFQLQLWHIPYSHPGDINLDVHITWFCSLINKPTPPPVFVVLWVSKKL